MSEVGDWSLRLSGHSLGGAICQLVTMMIVGGELGVELAEDRLQCFAFGSPPIFRHEAERKDEKYTALHTRLQSHIFSVVNGNDIVPSLSIGTVKKLLKSLRYAKPQTKGDY